MVGGFILVALFILIAGVLWLKNASISSSMVEYTVVFSNIGTLSVGDPVKVNGVHKGSVSSIALRGVKVDVGMKIDKAVTITDSTAITVQNIGLMGERMVGIQLSEKGNRIAPNSKGHITYINGHFDSGIAEAMGMVGSVMADVRTLIGNVAMILDSTVGDTSFVKTFRGIVKRLDNVTVLAQSLIIDNRSKIDHSLNNVETVTSDIKQLLDSNKASLNSIVSNGTQLSSKAVVIVQKVDSLTSQLQGMVSRIEQGQGSAGMLLKDDQFPKDLKKAVGEIDSLVNEIRSDGLKLRLHIDLFGSPKKKAQ